jgi:hypothetical protein
MSIHDCRATGCAQGAGVADLGFTEGQVIERRCSSGCTAGSSIPRDPAGTERLGRAPWRFRPAEEIYAVLLELEPEATEERRRDLMTEASSQVRSPVQYLDATFSVSKSITLLVRIGRRVGSVRSEVL